jgi:hypothetical protein
MTENDPASLRRAMPDRHLMAPEVPFMTQTDTALRKTARTAGGKTKIGKLRVSVKGLCSEIILFQARLLKPTDK